MPSPTVYVTYNSFAPEHTTGGTFYPTSFGSTYGVRALSPTTLTTLWDASLTGPAGHMVMSPDRATLYVAEANIQTNGADPSRTNGNVGNRVYLVDTATHTQTSTWTLPLFKEGTNYRGAPILSSLMFSPDGSEIWVMYCRLQGIAPTGAPYETLTPPSGQTYWGSIEAFDAATLTHIGPLIARSYGVSLEQSSPPYVTYFTGANGDTADFNSAMISCPMALSPDGATLYAVGSIPDGSWTDFIYPYPVTYYRLPVIFSYAITPPSGGGHYSLAVPATLLAGNVTGQPRDTAGNPPSGYRNQQFQQLFASPDSLHLYAEFGGGYTLRSVDVSTGAQIAQSVNTEGSQSGLGWGSFAYDNVAGQVYYASYFESSDNLIHVVAEGSIGSTPSEVNTGANIMFSMDAQGGFFFATSPLHASSGSVGTQTKLLKLSGSTLTDVSLPYVPWCVLADSGMIAGTTTTTESHTSTLLAPRMAADPMTGRIYLALGRCTYDENWTRTTSGGTDSLAFAGVANVTPHDVVLCVSGEESGDLPFTEGHALGAPIPTSPGTATSNCLAPDGLLTLSNEGEVRVAVGGYQRVGDAAPGVTDPRNYALRVTTDQGRTFADGLVSADDASLAHADVSGGSYVSGSPSYWGTWGLDQLLALQDERMAGHGRGEQVFAPDIRPLDLTPGVSSPPAGYEAVPQDVARLKKSVSFGATRYAFTHNQHVCIHRFPQFLARGTSGPFSTFHARWNDPAWPGATTPLPKDDSGYTITDAQTETSDMGVTVTAMSAPTVGAVDASLASVPGYPFVGDWQPGFLAPWLSSASDGTPAVSYGVMEWARGDGQGRTLTLVAVASVHRPYPRNSFTWAGSLEDGWCQHTDAEVFTPSATPPVTTGRDFGHHTCICVTSTTDGGASWGDLRILQVAGTPVLADTSDARIAACTTRGGRLVVCLCTGGVATLYASDDQGQDWVVLGASGDGGLTWA